MYFWNCHRVQILDWNAELCKSADFIGQIEKSQKISIKNKHSTKLRFFEPGFPIWKIFTNSYYEATPVSFVFTRPLCWSKKHHFSGVHRGSKFMHSNKSRVKISQNHASNLYKVFLKLPRSSDFGFQAWIWQISWFYRSNNKKSKDQHQKINIPSNSVFWFGDSEVLIQRKKKFWKTKPPRNCIMSFIFFLIISYL